jgi:hypothetical protein
VKPCVSQEAFFVDFRAGDFLVAAFFFATFFAAFLTDDRSCF